jgi:DNA-binding NarL/FixJ family response regulator
MDQAKSGSHLSESISVLVCDDAADMRRLLVRIIGLRDGLHVAGEAADGLEAIAEAKRLQPAVILLDLSMPRMTGLEALPEIRRVAPAALVVVLSGFSASIVAADVLAQGADRYLEKGASPSLITTTIEELVSANGRAIARPMGGMTRS